MSSEPKQSKKQMAQLKSMMSKLHEMARVMGSQKTPNNTIKLDEFQRLRQKFVSSAQIYQKATIKQNKQSDRIQKAKLTYQIVQNKHDMQSCLKQMTNITMKLHQKHKRKEKQQGKTKPIKKIKKDEMSDQIGPGDQVQIDPVQQQIEYKNLTIYNLQKCYFKLIKTQRRLPSYRAIKQNKQMTLSQLKRRAQQRPLVQQQDEQDLQQKQILQALKHIDDMIEQKLDGILAGVQLMNYNALSIRDGIDTVQKKIMVNLPKVNKNLQQLKKNQKRIDEASKYVTKPNCIINVFILILLGIIGYLVVRIVWFSDQQDDSNVIKMM